MLSVNENIYSKRLVDRMQGFWNRVRGDAELPESGSFSGAMIEDVWQHCLSFKVTETAGKNIYFCEFVGDNLKAGLGKDLKDKYFSSLETGGIVSRDFIKVLDESVDGRKPTVSQGQFINGKGRVVKYRDCVLPFSGVSGKVNLVVVGISWRAF